MRKTAQIFVAFSEKLNFNWFNIFNIEFGTYFFYFFLFLVTIHKWPWWGIPGLIFLSWAWPNAHQLWICPISSILSSATFKPLCNKKNYRHRGWDKSQQPFAKFRNMSKQWPKWPSMKKSLLFWNLLLYSAQVCFFKLVQTCWNWSKLVKTEQYLNRYKLVQTSQDLSKLV